MDLFWKISVVADNAERKDETVYCRTENILDAVQRYQVELLSCLGYQRNRALLRFRNLFERRDVFSSDREIKCIIVDGYWEDERGAKLNNGDAMHLLFGAPKDALPLISTEAHWIKFQLVLANGESPFGAARPSFSPYEQSVFRQFVKDAELLAESRFFCQASSFTFSVQGDAHELTTIGAEHVGHFTMVLRRLYGEQEHANFRKLGNIVHCHLASTPLGDWLDAERQKLNKFLSAPAAFFPKQKEALSFKNQQLIKTFLYSKYLHQPTKDDKEMIAAMAAEVGSVQALECAFYFLTFEIAGQLINWSQWITRLCAFSGIDVHGESSVVAAHKSTEPLPALEVTLAPDTLRKFEIYATELAFALRDSRVETKTLKPAHAFLEEARQKLREVL